MLEKPDFASHHRRCGKTKNLPEWEVPRHDGEHDTQRLERDPALPPVHVHRLIGEEFLGVVSVVVARRRAFLSLGDCRLDWLAHFEGHEPSKLPTFLFEQCGDFAHASRAVGKWCTAVLLE